MTLRERCPILHFDDLGDERGKLVVIEGGQAIPFEIKRVFYIYDSDSTVVRGQHANRESEFVLVNVAGESKVRITDGTEEFVVVLDKPSNLRTITDQLFAKVNVAPNVVFEVRECNAALQYVKLRFGASILPKVPAMDSDKVAAIPIVDENKTLVRTVYLSWLKGNPLSPAAQRVKNYIIDHYATPDSGETEG